MTARRGLISCVDTALLLYKISRKSATPIASKAPEFRPVSTSSESSTSCTTRRRVRSFPALSSAVLEGRCPGGFGLLFPRLCLLFSGLWVANSRDWSRIFVCWAVLGGPGLRFFSGSGRRGVWSRGVKRGVIGRDWLCGRDLLGREGADPFLFAVRVVVVGVGGLRRSRIRLATDRGPGRVRRGRTRAGRPPGFPRHNERRQASWALLDCKVF